jgi:hypothetical protein
LDSESGPEPEEPVSATSQPESPLLPAKPIPAALLPFVPPPRPPPPPDDVEMEQPVNAPRPVELKAGLPDDFLGNAKDAARWLLTISAYFAMNATIYSDDTKILTALNKMSKGRGKFFSESWYYKLANDALPDAEKTWSALQKNFKEMVCPFDLQASARHRMTELSQKKTREGFQDFVTRYQLVVVQSGMTDNIAIIDGLCQGLDKELVRMVLSMKDPPKDLKGWIKQASKFHAQQRRIDSIMAGRRSVGSAYTSRTPSRHDPNAMVFDALRLSPVERVEHMRKNQCFICHKVGCSTRNHRKDGRGANPASSLCPYRPPQVRAIETAAPPTPSPLVAYVQGLKGKTIGADEILWVLQMCYDRDKEEEESVVTNKVETTKGF